MKKLKPNLLFSPSTQQFLHSSFTAPSLLARTLSHRLSLTIVSDSLLCRSFASVESWVRSVLVNPKLSSTESQFDGNKRAEGRRDHYGSHRKRRSYSRIQMIYKYIQIHVHILIPTQSSNDLCECLRSLISSSYTNKSNEKQITNKTNTNLDCKFE